MLFALILAAATGCAGMNTSSSSGESAPSDDAYAQSQTPYEQTYENPNYYYDFDDVLVPRELSPVDKEKYVFTDSRFHAGFRIFEGRVVAEDLYNFFVTNMAKDNWELKYSLKSVRSLLVFEKQSKSCTITIEDGYKTKVTVFAIELRGAQPSVPSSGAVRTSDIPD
jgi:hypothetical protein